MKKIWVIAALLMFSTNVFAGILLEPYVGYETGTAKGDIGGTTAFKISGPHFGAKVGYGIMGLGFGVDVAKANLKGKDTTTAGSDLDMKATDLGAFVQFQFPVLIKVSLTYFADSRMTSESAGSAVEFKGNGTKIGIGFTGLPFIAINLDAISEKYEDIKFAGIALTGSNIDRKSLMLSVSAPFNF